MDTKAIIDKFNEAFGRGDVDGIMAMMTKDCVFENTDPAPDGTRHEGQIAVRDFWNSFFKENPGAKFLTEELFIADDRAVVRWRYDWGDGHVRGVDVMKVKDGKVAEKLSYVKG